MEVVYQGPVTAPDNSTLKRHTCDAYNGPIFTNLPKPGQRVEVMTTLYVRVSRRRTWKFGAC